MTPQVDAHTKQMLITFEGIDFSGKSTQISLLERWLAARLHKCTLVREPGGTHISEKIRDVLLDKENYSLCETAEMLLFSAARAQVTREVILPALNRGEIVLCDRYFDSTTAYQGFGRGIDLDAIAHVNALASHGLTPRRTYFLDITYAQSTERKHNAGVEADRMERSDSTFFERVRTGYLTLAESHPDRFVRIDASATASTVHHIIAADVESLLLEFEKNG